MQLGLFPGAKRLRRFFPYFGTKSSHHHRYPWPRYDTIVEPFAGGAGYSHGHYQRQVVLVDLDPRVVALWRYIIGTPSDEIAALPLLEIGGRVDDLDVCEGARLLISCWANPIGPFRNQATEFCDWNARTRARIAEQCEHVRHWRVLDAQSYDSVEIDGRATWFVDPPYQRNHGSQYRHSARRIDFDALGAWCRSRCGQTIVCEAGDADWLPFRPLFRAQRSHGQVLRTSSEVVWTSSE